MKTIKDTAALLPRVTGWKAPGAPGVQSCDAGFGVEGVKYGYLYGAPPPGGDHAADADTVAAYWRKLGMDVRIVVTNGEPTVYGENGPTAVISFSTAPGNYVLSGTSLCVPGDYDEMYKEQNQATE